MAVQGKQAFIKTLVSDHHRRRPLMRPVWRAVVWFITAFLVSAVLMRYVQAFRPGFAGQLVHHPFLLIEFLSALLFPALGAYIVLARATPGEKSPRNAIIALWFIVVMYIIGFVAGFTRFAPESSTVGARHACWLEVLVYGTVCLLIFVLLVRRGLVRFSWTLGLLYGLIAGFVPAALMQMACMYDPSHGLMFHYLPVVALIPLGLVAMCFARR